MTFTLTLLLNLGSSSYWKMNLRRKRDTQLKLFVSTKAEPPKAKVEAYMGFKGKFNTQPKCTRDVKCSSVRGLYITL